MDERSFNVDHAIEVGGFDYNIRDRTYRMEICLNSIDYAVLAVDAFLTAASTILWHGGYGTYMFTYSLLKHLF